MKLSTRARTLRPSPTLALDARVKDLIRAGGDVISLGAGEPDFDTPIEVIEAAHAAALAGKTKYTAVAGIPELRAAIAGHLCKTHGIAVEACNILVTNGAKQALYNALQTLVDPGDEVIVFSPYWVSYPDMIALAGGRQVAVSVNSTTFEPDATAFERAITNKTRGLIMNTPNNPTGAVYSKTILEKIVRIAAERNLWILSDEIYEMLVYDGMKHISPASIGGEGLARTMVASGLSKSYAMTGWRLGYLAAPGEVAEAAATIQGQMTSNVNTPTQWAAIRALEADPEKQKCMVREFEARRTLLVNGLRRALGKNVDIPEPKGAFYLMMNAKNYLNKRFGDYKFEDDQQLAAALLERGRVAMVPGSAFGAPGFLRMSYATSRENLQKAIDRIAVFFNELES
ncbi:MAG: pyridoxal phosphate-dependent aminotransferase [Planctomycetes bacterium]|nr:pyridoxal phosphate-dependent aminotransferase [Planctomycetota bacterium]